MRLISWNIDHPKKKVAVEKVLRVLQEEKPDVVALQEVPRQVPQELPEGLSRLGLQYKQPFTPRRGWGLLVASRWPLDRLEGALIKIPKDEEDYYRGRHPAVDGEPARLLSVLVNCPKGMFELHTVHVPPGSQAGWRKIDTFRALAARLEKHPDHPRIVCGDFNEPRAELSDRGIETWAWHNEYAKQGSSERWDEAVKRIVVECPAFGLSDVVRNAHGNRVLRMASHFPRGNGKPRRYDHVFASSEFRVINASYLTKSNWAQVSDHIPAMIELGLE